MFCLNYLTRLRGKEILALARWQRAQCCLHQRSSCSNGYPHNMPAETQVLRFRKLSKTAFAPVQGSDKAAGLDLKSAHDLVIAARGRALVRTDLQICVPSGCYGRVAPRSGLALKNGIDTGAGVIDEDYRGNVGVLLFNHTDTDFEIKTGDRIAQLICEKITYPQLQEVQDIENTARGENGFGSTGV